MKNFILKPFSAPGKLEYFVSWFAGAGRTEDNDEDSNGNFPHKAGISKDTYLKWEQAKSSISLSLNHTKGEHKGKLWGKSG